MFRCLCAYFSFKRIAYAKKKKTREAITTKGLKFVQNEQNTRAVVVLLLTFMYNKFTLVLQKDKT